MRTSWRAVEEAVASGDAAKAAEALRTAESETMRAVSKGVVHKNLGSRKVARLARSVNAISRSPKS
jgi:small subunit ribosomal protein S20